MPPATLSAKAPCVVLDEPRPTRQASEIPVHEDKGMSPGQKRGVELAVDSDKRAKNPGFDLDMLKALLGDQANTITGEHERSIESGILRLQERQDEKIDGLESKIISCGETVYQIKHKQDDLEARVAKLELGGDGGLRSPAAASTGPGEDRYKNVIIVGGWPEKPENTYS